MLLSLGGCAPGRGVVELTVGATGQLNNVDTIVVRISQRGQPAQPVEFAIPKRPVSIPPKLVFELLFTPDRRGTFDAKVEALDPSRAIIASADGVGEVLPSQITTMMVSLPGVTLGDMKDSDGSDGSDSSDGPPADATAPLDAKGD